MNVFTKLLSLSSLTIFCATCGSSSPPPPVGNDPGPTDSPESIAQQAYVKASNTEAQDKFGSVALDGDTLAVGTTREDSNATGVNGDQADNSLSESGAAYVFE